MKGINDYYETFFINDSTIQYFIKPLQFKNNSLLMVDFTFRKSKENFSDITMNFSDIGLQKSEIDTIYLQCTTTTYAIPIDKLLYKELNKNGFTYRYNSTIPYYNLNDFLSSEHPRIKINGEIYLPTKPTLKSLGKIKRYLLDFELKE